MLINRSALTTCGAALVLAAGCGLFGLSAFSTDLAAQGAALPVLKVPMVQDFAVTGRGDNAAWNDVAWTPMSVRGGTGPSTRIKVAYSSTGVYVFMDAADKRLTASYEEDFSDLWKEDVFEVFLWPDERDSLYFEYEVSPLGRELPILVPNFEGRFLGWRPWHYGGDRRVRHEVSIVGGPKETGAAIEGWRAEIKIPFALMTPLRGVPAVKGSRWRANFYRMDHDGGPTVYWHWAPVPDTFHAYGKFGTLEFM